MKEYLKNKARREQGYILIIPKELDIDEFLQKNPPNQIKSFDKWKLLYFIHLLNYIPAISPSQRRTSGFIRISSRLLKKSAVNYEAYLKYLRLTGIIARNNSYSAFAKFKKYSKSYKLIAPFNKAEFQFVEMPKERFRTSLIKEFNVDESKPEIIDQYSNLKAIAINETAALKFLQDIEGELRLELDNGLIEYYQQRKREIVINLWRFNSHQISMIVDNTAGRLHSNLTGLKSEFRNFLSFKGENLVGIDIKNCQPFLLQRILEIDFWVEQFEIPQQLRQRLFPHIKQTEPIQGADLGAGATDQVDTEENTVPVSQQTTGDNKTGKATYRDILHRIEPITAQGTEGKGITEAFNMWQNRKNDGFSDFEAELARYKANINGGKFYEHLAEIANTKIKSDDNFKAYLPQFCHENDIDTFKFDRPATKKLVMLLLFGPANSKNPQAEFARMVFECDFPIILQILNNLKRLWIRVDGVRINKYSSLAILLQALESEIVLRRIVPRIKNELFDAPVFTIHDSLLTTKQYVDDVTRIIKSEFEIAIGAIPELKDEGYSPQNVNVSEFCEAIKHKYYERIFEERGNDAEDEDMQEEFDGANNPL